MNNDINSEERVKGKGIIQFTLLHRTEDQGEVT